MRKLIFALLLVPVLSFAQGTTTQIRHGGTLPAACSPLNGDTFFKTGTTPGLYDCPTTNTWRFINLGATLDTDTALTANSDTRVPSQKAIKSYVDAAVAGGGLGTVTHTGALTANRIVLGNDTADVTVLGSLGTTTTVLHGNASGAPSFGAVVGGDMSNNTVTSTQLAIVNTRRTCMITVGDGTNTVVSGDYSPFKVNRCYIPYAATIVEVLLQSDAGTPSVQLQKRHGASTVTDLLSGALAAAGTTKTCAMSATSQTCIDGTTSSGSITVSTTSLAAGDYIEVKSGTASTETNMTIAVSFTVN